MKNCLVAIFACLSLGAYAQQSPIMVCNAGGNICTPYSNLDTSITYALPGDYIYLPGGSFPITIPINKELHIIGAGHYPDSTLTTGATHILGNLELTTGCNSSSFEGFYLSGSFSPLSMFSPGPVALSSITIIRCNVGGIGTNHYSNSFFLQNVVRGVINTGTGTNNIITNSIIGGLSDISSSLVKNCIFFEGSSSFGGLCGHFSSFDRVSNSILKNNIFMGVMGTTYAGNGFCMYASSGNTFINNLTTTSGGLNHGPMVESGTSVNVPVTNLFVNASTFGFDYAKDFHVLSSSPAAGSGDDNTDRGIYGSSVPYKESAVPANPHIYFKAIGGVTTTTGDLPVQIKVRSEN